MRRASDIFLKSGPYGDSKYVNIFLIYVRKFVNLAVNFEILDFENFLFSVKVAQTCNTFLKSGDHEDSKYVNFKILAARKFKNFTLNFEILDFENFLFCEKVPQTCHTDA